MFVKKKIIKKLLPLKQELTRGVKADSHSRVFLPYNLMEPLLQLNAVSLCTERERTGRAENSRDENSSITIMEPVQIEIMRGNPAVWDLLYLFRYIVLTLLRRSVFNSCKWSPPGISSSTNTTLL